MKNLFKKISVGALSALLIGGVLSQGSIVYANSALPNSQNDLSRSVEVIDYGKKRSEMGIRLLSELVGFRIIGKNLKKENIYQYIDKYRDKSLNYLRVKRVQDYFENYVYFMKYIYNKGLQVGIYIFQIAGQEFIIEVRKEIKRGSISLFEYANYIGRKLDEYYD